MLGSTGTPARPAAAYEALRASVLSPHSHARLGRAYLQHRGMAAWLQSWPARRPATAGAPQPRRSRAEPGAGSLGSNSLASVAAAASVLADMLLSNLTEVTT